MYWAVSLYFPGERLGEVGKSAERREELNETTLCA